MKKIILALTLVFAFMLALPANSFAQEKDNHTMSEEAKGREIFSNLQAKQVKCKNLTDDNFEALGEYFMGQFIGDTSGDTSRHIAMNAMMVGMMGKEGEEQMHAIMGKRMSNCEPDAPMPQNMMNTMMNGMMWGGGNSMTSNFGFNWIFMILFWGLVILGIVALIKWIANQGKSQAKGKPALDILKERYIRGDITKKEFEEMKKVIS